jgi:hypothetical protein
VAHGAQIRAAGHFPDEAEEVKRQRMRWLGLRALGVAAIAAVVLTVASTGSRRHPVAAALAADAGTATLTFPANAYDTCGSCLPSSSLVFLYTQVSSANPIPLTVSATPPAGATIKSVVLQYAPAGTTSVHGVRRHIHRPDGAVQRHRQLFQP